MGSYFSSAPESVDNSSNSNHNYERKMTAVTNYDNKKLQWMAKEAEASIAKDPSLPNVLSNFANLLQRPDLLNFEELVSASKENWQTILGALKKLSASNHINAVEVQEMEAIYDDYWSLLLRTRLGIEILIKKCKLQRRNVKMFLEIIQECKSNKGGELSKDDQTARQECIERLGDWLKIDELDTLIKEWSQMESRLKSEHKKWKKISASVSAKKGENLSYLALAFASVARVCLEVQLTVMKCGGASAEAINAASLTPFELTVLRLQNALLKMAVTSKSFQDELSKTKDKIMTKKDYEEFRNAKSLRKMKSSSIAINEYLDDYIRQGEAVISTVNDACQEMIHC